MDVQKELASVRRRVNANTARRCEEALRRVGIEPPPQPHPAEEFGYQIGMIARSWNEAMEALARGMKRARR